MADTGAKEEPKSGVSRRQVLKTAGAIGAVAAGAAALGWGYTTGSSPLTKQGWENRMGITYFDRTPFEVDKPTYETVGTVERFDPNYHWDIRYTRMPDSWPADGIAGLDPDMQAFYAENPELLEYDKDHKYGAGVTNHKYIADTAADRQRFNEGDAYLSMIRFYAYQAPFPLFTTANEPPEVTDWKGVATKRAEFISPEAASAFIKRQAAEFGASICRITKVNPAYIYKTVKADTRGWKAGEPVEIKPWWKYAIVTGRQMYWETLAADPNYGTSFDAYATSAWSAFLMTAAVKALGYSARLNCPPSNYEALMTPFAVDSGMGELSRIGVCVTPEFGGNVRPSVIFTDLELAVDRPIDVGIAKFCENCKLCAEVCPVNAINTGDQFVVRGVKKWAADGAACSDGWDVSAGGKGCRVCLDACPFAKPNDWLHATIRDVITRDKTGITYPIAQWAERNLYGRPDPQTFLAPNYLGYRDPPEWLRTADFVRELVPTPKEYLGGGA